MTLHIPPCLWNERYVTDLLRRYWADLPDGSPAYTGSRFDSLGGGGERREVANRFTAEDFLAVSTFSVNIPVRAVLHVLEPVGVNHYTVLLRKIPTGIDLADADERHVGEGSAAWRLWDLLCDTRGIGSVGAGKLLARKRPRLLPVYDTVIKKVFTRPPKDVTFWTDVRRALRQDDRRLVAHLQDARTAAGLSKEISVLRVLDSAAWLHGKDGR